MVVSWGLCSTGGVCLYVTGRGCGTPGPSSSFMIYDIDVSDLPQFLPGSAASLQAQKKRPTQSWERNFLFGFWLESVMTGRIWKGCEVLM